MNRIELIFAKADISLAGFPYGKEVYEEQVKEKIDISDITEIVFPERIEYIASSFVQGFFSEIINMVGYKVVEKNIIIVTGFEELTESVYENLY